MKKLSEIQENLEKKFGEFSNKINEEEYFTKEVKTIKREQIMELENSINEMSTVEALEIKKNIWKRGLVSSR